ncbi:hypothetical protein M404DRAFT_23895 [Pisolithus tinctorius Marx 270]|uniref:XPG-I domain-containing protein n=1 Tax=Pisolithus tinctorius Marx 270 TaxID=870435 RepID=A0A0C3PHC6_PISTI|nr:hypothetical protein M404DRAFT_23895 [Pisolithus tinctorius Marx 270]
MLTSWSAPPRSDLIHPSITHIEYIHSRIMVLALWPVANLIFVSWALAYAYVNWLSLVLPLSTILLTSPRSPPHMRVSELWPLLAPAARPYMLSQLAAEMFDPSSDDGGVRLLTVGFNASFNWHVAPGEADVELANLQSYGLIEAVVTLYNDVLLFGVTCIIRSISGTPYSTRYEDILVYSSKDIENCASLELGDLYLILLMSSVDAETGNQWCSMDVARRLAKYGFGRSLLRVATTLQFAKFMSFVSKWHDSLLGHRHYELACIIVEECIEFPDPAVLAMYLLPLTSWLDNGHPPVTVVMSRQPDLTSLVEFCSQHLDWPPDIIQSRLVDAHAGAAVRALIQLSIVFTNQLMVFTYVTFPLTDVTGTVRSRPPSVLHLCTAASPTNATCPQLNSLTSLWYLFIHVAFLLTDVSNGTSAIAFLQSHISVQQSDYITDILLNATHNQSVIFTYATFSLTLLRYSPQPLSFNPISPQYSPTSPSLSPASPTSQLSILSRSLHQLSLSRAILTAALSPPPLNQIFSDFFNVFSNLLRSHCVQLNISTMVTF